MRLIITDIVRLLFGIVFLISCTKSLDTNQLYVPTESDTTATASLEELQQGRELYINNCSNCHALPSPDDYSVSGWYNVLQQMAPKTSLNTQELSMVKKYLCRGHN